MRHLNPEGWTRPRGYSNGIEAQGRTVYVAGMIGWDIDGRFSAGLVAQLRTTLENTVAVLEAGDMSSTDIVRMTWYVKNLDDYRENLEDIGRVYRDVIGKHYPVMAVVGVNDLVEREALIEIETTAVGN